VLSGDRIPDGHGFLEVFARHTLSVFEVPIIEGLGHIIDRQLVEQLHAFTQMLDSVLDQIFELAVVNITEMQPDVQITWTRRLGKLVDSLDHWRAGIGHEL
jgi:hypothetical protein